MNIDIIITMAGAMAWSLLLTFAVIAFVVIGVWLIGIMEAFLRRLLKKILSAELIEELRLWRRLWRGEAGV